MVKIIDPIKSLEQFVAGYPTRLDACHALGIGYQFLSDMLHGRRAVSKNVLEKLGLVTVAVKAPKASTNG